MKMSSVNPDGHHAPSPSSVFKAKSLGTSPIEQGQMNTQANGSISSIHFNSLDSPPSFRYSAALAPLDTVSAQAYPILASPLAATPNSAGLRIQTDHLEERSKDAHEGNRNEAGSGAGSSKEGIQDEGTKDQAPASDAHSQQTVFNAGLPVRTSSIRSVYGSRPQRTDSLSPRSVMSSPGVGPLADMTPLPSPISLWGSPKLWRTSTIDDETDKPVDLEMVRDPLETSPQLTPFTRIPSKKRKVPSLVTGPGSQEANIFNPDLPSQAYSRSISDYKPHGLPILKVRNVVASTSENSDVKQQLSPPDDLMHREQYLAIQRGLAAPKPPTPPDSNCESGNLEHDASSETPRPAGTPGAVVYEARTLRRGQMKRWQTLRRLGKGEFSTVYLATSDFLDSEAQDKFALSEKTPQSKSLVAVKIAEHGPAGGVDEQKVETSIRREVELMKSINHPSIVHLMAVNECDRRTIIVENYCAGGDLFDLASQSLQLLTPSFIRRIFAELVAAVRYLHLQYIVHRDIKLENVLVNLSSAEIKSVTDWQTYASPTVTLTDLGLGRWIPKPPASPMLSTRCGSEDYAAPEVLLGDEYDGRSTDSWALGVLLYAIMEGRLPFDPIPGSRRKTPTSHRIARCDWQWLRYADENAEWDTKKGKDLEGAARVVEGLLAKRRSRWTLEKIKETPWVSRGIDVQGGLGKHDIPYTE